MDKTIKMVAALGIIFAVVSAVVIFGEISKKPEPFPTPGSGTLSLPQGNVVVYFFYGEECPHCDNVMPFITNLSKTYPDVDLRILEVWHNEANKAIYTTINQQMGISPPGVPEVVIGNTALVGDRDIPAKLENLIKDYLKKKN